MEMIFFPHTHVHSAGSHSLHLPVKKKICKSASFNSSNSASFFFFQNWLLFVLEQKMSE